MIRLKRLYAHDFKQLSEVELHFPEAGRILVQGKNEAGKSTLFEAVLFALFGQPLATESGRANLEDLIAYEKNKARVELDVALRDRLFRITRTLNRNRPNVYTLDIMSGDRVEEVRGNKPVNDRLVSEFGFDAEALLNTCFVEQKKLEKLESLGKSKREESLSRLLNLDRLLEMEEGFKLRGEDEKMIARLLKRFELAEAQEQLPIAEQDLTMAERQLKLIELRLQITQAAQEKRDAERLNADLSAMEGRRDELRQVVERVNALDKAKQSIATALDRFDLLNRQTESLAELRREQAETARAAAEQLPALERRRRILRKLSRQLARLGLVEQALKEKRTEAERLETLQRELDGSIERQKELHAATADQEVRADALDRKLLDYDLGDALGEWATAASEQGLQAVGAEALAKTKEARDKAAARFRTAVLVPAAVLAALVAATVFIPIALVSLARLTALALGLGSALILLDLAVAAFALNRAAGIWGKLARATEEYGNMQGGAAVRQQTAAGAAARLEVARSRLERLGTAVPPSVEAAQSRRIEIAATLENKTRPELQLERDAARERFNYFRLQVDDITKRIDSLQSEGKAGDLAPLRHGIDKCTHMLGRWHTLERGRAVELGVVLDMQSVRDALRDGDSDLRALRSRVNEAAKLGTKIADGEKQLRKMQGELAAAYEPARGLLDGRLAPWSEALLRSAYSGLEQLLTEQFEANGGEHVREDFQAVERKIGACEREHKLREEAARKAAVAAKELLDDLGVEGGLAPQPSLAELEELGGKFDQIPLYEKAPLETRVKSLHQRVGALTDTRGRLERELGLQGEVLDVTVAREELQKEVLSQEERKQAAEIVLRARKRIVQKVLPATMDYMRRILPQLTRDRYHDAELDAETYKIRVWDERAGQSGAWKEKNIFSGGTKDQFSLALRLAFALATLPQERGTSPGFIFLDEPLGSFDDERASALLYLLTEGEIGRAFDQVFLISHVRVQENRFSHQIRLESGVLVEDNLSTRDSPIG